MCSNYINVYGSFSITGVCICDPINTILKITVLISIEVTTSIQRRIKKFFSYYIVI